MTIRNSIDAFMAKLGYIRAPAKIAPQSIPLTFDVDSTQIKETLVQLDRVQIEAKGAEAALLAMTSAANASVAALSSLEVVAKTMESL